MDVTCETSAEDLEITTTEDPPWPTGGDDTDDLDNAPTIRMLPASPPV